MPRKVLSVRMEDLLALNNIEFVYNRLIKAGVDPEVRTRITRSWRAHKELEKQKRAEERTIDIPWKQHIGLFRQELARAVSAAAHCDPGNLTKLQALQEYIDCLRRHRDRVKLLALTAAGRTPTDYARAKKLPNNGATWPDWIDPAERERIERVFNSLPPVPHGRPFEVFRQRTHKPHTLARINKLRASLLRAISEAETKIDLYPTHRDFHREELRGLLQAQERLDQFIVDPASLGMSLPPTYFGLLSKEHRDALVQINRPTDGRRKPPEKTHDEKLYD